MDLAGSLRTEESESDRSRRRSGRSFFARIAHWSPVFICMILFGQVSFLGLRPAVCERRRLTEAQTMLETRHARDLWLRDQVTLNLRARSDPIYLERQRRIRIHGPQLRGE